MSVYNGVTFITSATQGPVTGTVSLSVSDMDPIDRIDFLIVVEGSDRQVGDPTTAPPDGSPGPWVYEKTVLLDPTNATTVTPRAYFRDGTTFDADPASLGPMVLGSGGTLEVQDGTGGAVQTATRLVFPARVSNVPTGSETATIDLDGHYAALEHRHPWSDLDGVPVFASRWPTLAEIGINQGVSTTNQPTFTGVALQPANPSVNNTGILMSSGAFAALELQTTDGAGVGHPALHIYHAASGGVVGVGRIDPSISYRMDVWGGMRLTDPSGSKPNGTVAPAIELLRLERAGSLNYSYNEAAEFRIGHGGPSVYGTNLELWINGGVSTGTPDTRVATFGYDGSVSVNGESRTNSWFRNETDGTGLVNTANSYHWFADSASTRWVSRSVSGIEVRNSTNSVRGYLYFADPGGRDCFGLLGRQGEWAISIDGASGRIGYNTTPHANWAHNLNGDVFVSNGWLRVDGNVGVYFNSWNGGWYMQDADWVRSYADKGIYTGGEVRAARYTDANDPAYYLDPAGSSNLNGTYVRGELNFGQLTRQMMTLWSDGISSYGIGVQSQTLYLRTYGATGGFAFYRGGSHSDSTWAAGAGGVMLATLNSDGTFMAAGDLQDKWTASGMYLCHIIPRGTFDNTISAPIGTLQAIF